uniref:Prepronociceptin a n=1 Tax=Electrophorus electricus TaxID=8005 RepID=A0A4W4EIH1_ELEEL
MKTPLWTLLLLGLFVPGHSDCQRDCLSCSQILPKDHAFNTLVCLVECHSEDSLGLTWEICRTGAMLKRAEEEVGAVLFDHVVRALDLDKLDQENYDSQKPRSEEKDEGDAEGDRELGSDQEGTPMNLTKRFGGFFKSKYGYRKFADPGRSLQKRYGGFIGVRKSARKWNNQKRFSEFLKQYLGMTTRASEFNSVSTDITQQNEV